MGLVRLPLDERGHPIQVLKFGDVRSVAFDATATTIGAVVGSSIVRLFATQMCHVLFGASPTAATTDTPLAADTPEYLQAHPGVDIVSVIGTLTTATARLWVTDCR
jgi:hypothetical protein